MDNLSKDIGNRIKGNVCSKCGGPAPYWKCPKCGEESEMFDPEHWKNCRFGAKMQAKCEACNQAEENCTCKPLA